MQNMNSFEEFEEKPVTSKYPERTGLSYIGSHGVIYRLLSIKIDPISELPKFYVDRTYKIRSDNGLYGFVRQTLEVYVLKNSLITNQLFGKSKECVDNILFEHWFSLTKYAILGIEPNYAFCNFGEVNIVASELRGCCTMDEREVSYAIANSTIQYQQLAVCTYNIGEIIHRPQRTLGVFGRRMQS